MSTKYKVKAILTWEIEVKCTAKNKKAAADQIKEMDNAELYYNTTLERVKVQEVIEID